MSHRRCPDHANVTSSWSGSVDRRCPCGWGEGWALILAARPASAASDRSLPDALEPGFHCVTTHWIRGFTAFPPMLPLSHPQINPAHHRRHGITQPRAPKSAKHQYALDPGFHGVPAEVTGVWPGPRGSA
jgi:hypothetical protein